MMSWGSGLQRSYLSDADTVAQHHHVRFEACQGKKMGGFRLKVVAQHGAQLKNLHAVTVAYADFTKFVPEDAAEYEGLASVRIKKVPRKSQFALKHPEKHRLCSPTSCAILVEYFSQGRCDMHTVAHNVFDQGLDSYGSWPFNMAHAFELCRGSHWWRVIRMNSFAGIYKMLQKGYPVAVSVRGSLPGAPKSYDNGHLIVIIGYDAATHKIICHDPACASDKNSVRKYPLADFLRAWEKSHRLTYCACERT
jgi:Peptidase_C39 like family